MFPNGIGTSLLLAIAPMRMLNIATSYVHEWTQRLKVASRSTMQKAACAAEHHTNNVGCIELRKNKTSQTVHVLLMFVARTCGCIVAKTTLALHRRHALHE